MNRQKPFCFASVNKQGDVTRTTRKRDAWCNKPLFEAPTVEGDLPDGDYNLIEMAGWIAVGGVSMRIYMNEEGFITIDAYRDGHEMEPAFQHCSIDAREVTKGVNP